MGSQAQPGALLLLLHLKKVDQSGCPGTGDVQGSHGEQLGVCPCQTSETGKGFYVTCPGLCPCRALLYEVCPCVHWDMLCVACRKTGIVSSEMGMELLHSLGAVFPSNRQFLFRLLFYRAVTGQAQEAGNLVEVREKRDLGRSHLAVFSFLCLNPLAQDTWSVFLHLTT